MRIRSPRGSGAPPTPATPEPWCHAPTTALYFAPDGSVFPCCAGFLPIGRFVPGGGTSLHEIWVGATVGRIRDAVAVGDLSAGCGVCEVAVSSDGRAASLAVQFDRYAGRARPWPVDLEFALSNTCNLQCVMWHGELSSAIRSQREHLPALPAAYDDRFFEELATFLPHAERIAFKGGEPFLATEARRVMDLLLDQGSTAEIKVTTNGTIWNDRVARYATDLRMSPILSIDAVDRRLLEQLRVGVRAEDVWRNVDRFQAVAERVGVGFTFSYCLMRSNWQELAPLLVEAERRDAWVHVSLLTQPEQHTLLGMDGLEEVLSTMSTQGEALDLAPARRATWDQALAWVRHCLDAPTPLRDVVVPQPVAAPSVDRRNLERRLVRELEAWTDDDLLVLLVRDSVVVDVDAPPWARRWGAERWVGAAADDLVALLATGSGTELALEVSSRELDGAERTVGVLHDDRGRERLRVLALQQGIEETLRLALAPADRP